MRTRQFRAFNDNCYLTAHAGETYENIAGEIGIKAHKLAKYNEQPEDTRLNEGEIVWLRKKKHHVPDNITQQRATKVCTTSLNYTVSD